MSTKKMLMLILLLSVILAATACSASLADSDSGSIGLMPFTDEEFGIRGVVPWVCRRSNPGDFECEGLTPDQSPAALIQQSFPGSRDELIPVLLDRVSVEQAPDKVGNYRGAAFTWDLYAFETQIVEAGSEAYRIDLALAEGDSASYLVALVTVPDVYDANAALYKAVFTRAVYALAPLE